MTKFFRVEVPIWATAYIRAADEAEAMAIAIDRLSRAEVTLAACDSCDVTGAAFTDLSNSVSLSPAATIGDGREIAFESQGEAESDSPVVNVTHVDTCLACYVLDHCNGAREILLGVCVDHESTFASVKADLIAEWKSADLDGREDAPDDSAVLAEIESAFASVAGADIFAPSIEAPAEGEESDDSGESVYAWFRIDWEGGAQ